ncbi:MAG: LLM class flavin-dependent oxidoreductase [Alphaproteobacteria bacterium]|nr:LLM class flavin-dependent oxidoreductase [Alphaproteobacteria bacterium]
MTILSVLDQSPIRAGGSAGDAIHETLELAGLADRLGYHRYWLAEHHNSAGLAGSAPEILIGQVAARTQRLRVGSGGVMLSHYSPYKVAELFRMLETLFPGRIDMGLGRAPGSDQLTAMALQYSDKTFSPDQYPHQLAALFAFINDAMPADHPFARVHAVPLGPTTPEAWLLGSSDQSGLMAAYFGCGFSFAHFITGEGGPSVMAAYRQNFRPSAGLAEAKGSIGVHVICAESEAAADRAARSRDLWRLRNDRGIHLPVPTVEEAMAYEFSPEENARAAWHRQRQVIGDPDQCNAKLLALGRDYGVDEFVVVTVVHDFQVRKRSYELLAEVFGIS